MDQVSEFRDSPRAIGARLKLMRQAVGLSQAQAAHRVGLAVSTWNSYEKGKFTPKPEHRRVIEAKFRVPPEWIMYGREDDLSMDMHRRLEAARLISEPPLLFRSA